MTALLLVLVLAIAFGLVGAIVKGMLWLLAVGFVIGILSIAGIATRFTRGHSSANHSRRAH